MTQKTTQNPWTMDVRVRERNLKSGALTEKDLEKFLSALPDLEDQSEAFATPQPALAQPPAPPPVPVMMSHISDEDEGDDDEDSTDDIDGAAEAAPAAHVAYEEHGAVQHGYEAEEPRVPQHEGSEAAVGGHDDNTDFGAAEDAPNDGEST